MKNKAIIFIFLALILGFQVNADVWRVNNRTIVAQTVYADFTTLQDAIDGASANDTLYIEGSATSYGAGTLAKPLVIIGTGYFLTDNDTTQAYNQSSNVDLLTFNPGSEGSVAMGLRFYRSYALIGTIYAVQINTDSITIRKNYLYTANSQTGSYGYGYPAIAISVGSFDDIVISQNYIVASMAGAVFDISTAGISISADAKCYINNNIFYPGPNNNPFAIVTGDSSSNEIYINNNVFYNLPIKTYYSTFLNNIMDGGTYTIGAGDVSQYNICSGTQFPSGNFNLQNQTMSSIFVDHTTGAEAGFKLKAGSPAIGYGISGGDCGVFSNDTGDSYVLSGMPEIPAIFEASIDYSVGIDTIPVNIKAISHNESK